MGTISNDAGYKNRFLYSYFHLEIIAASRLVSAPSMEIVTRPIKSPIVRIVTTSARPGGGNTGLIAEIIIPDTSSWEGTLHRRVV